MSCSIHITRSGLVKVLLALIIYHFSLVNSTAQDIGDPEFVPMVKVGKTLYEGDSILYMEMQNV